MIKERIFLGYCRRYFRELHQPRQHIGLPVDLLSSSRLWQLEEVLIEDAVRKRVEGLY